MRYPWIFIAIALLAGCSSTPIEKLVDTSPKWYLAPPTEDGIIYASGMSASPDLQFAVDRALLQAKSGLADRVKGKTSVLSRSHVAQSGNVVSGSDDKTIKNVAKDVNLGGYELVKSEAIPDMSTFSEYVLLKYVPTGGGLDRAVSMLDETHVTGASVTAAVIPAPPKKVIAYPIGMAPPIGVVNDEPTAPSAAPREAVTPE